MIEIEIQRQKVLMEKLWLKRLHFETEQILWQYNIQVPSFAIQLNSSSEQLGSWDNKRNIITISKNIIWKYSWNIVIEILKHEIAHCYVDTYFPEAKPHGKEFKKACLILRVEPWAQYAKLEIENLATTLNQTKKLAPKEERVVRIAKNFWLSLNHIMKMKLL